MGTRRREGGGPQSASRKHKERLLDPPLSISRGTPQLPLCPLSPVLPAILLITTQNSDFISSPSEPSVGITGAG